MIRSMTAYGRSLKLSALGQWLVEIHSVNKKNLDFNVVMSKELLRFDPEVRKYLSSFCKRGQVAVKIFLTPDPVTFFTEGRIEYLRSVKLGMEKACKELGCACHEITFPFLYEQMHAATGANLSGREEEIREDLFSVMKLAVAEYEKMKCAEGSHLSEALEKHLSCLEELLGQIRGSVDGSSERRRKKILDKLKEFKEITEEDRERVLREVFLYVEKSDITEEITRLFSHIEQFRLLLKDAEGSVGRTMDFLVQEMGRESNTISAKSDDKEISLIALRLKAEVEKIREQVQNVE